MPTTRIVIQRAPHRRIMLEALAAFRALLVVERDDLGDDEWWEAHSQLHRALGAKLWEWPIIPHSDESFPPNWMRWQERERWKRSFRLRQKLAGLASWRR